MALDKARVLIVDNDARIRQLLKEILEQEGYSVQIAQGAGQKLVQDTRRLANSFRPHVAVVDLRISGSSNLDTIRVGDKGGLEILKELPDTLCILRSAFLTSSLTAKAIQEHNAFKVIDASAPPRQLLDIVRNAAQQKNAASRKFEVKWPSHWNEKRIIQALFPEEKDVPLDIVKDILGQLFSESSKVSLEPLEKSVTTPGDVIRGRSVVLKARIDNKLEPLIVKLGPAHRIRTEAENYAKYIDGNLGGHYHTNLVTGPVTFWKLGGLVYKFFGGDQQGIRLFADFYREHNQAKDIVKPIKHFFKVVWFNHHKNAIPLDRPLFDMYDDVLRIRKRLDERLSHLLTAAALSDMPNIALSLPNPVSWVLRHIDDRQRPESRQAITHGDLHGGNIFVHGEHSWIIDFERTGPGHVLQDFVEIEVDIVTRLTNYPKNDLSLLFELAVFLSQVQKPKEKKLKNWPRLQNNPDMVKAVGVVTRLRKLARKITHTKDLREYLWGLLFDALFVAAMSKKQQRIQALLYSAVLCHRLQNMDDPWPPVDWPQPVELVSHESGVETLEERNITALQRLIHRHNRRLQLLQEKAASAGASADPWILIEIEDVKEKIKKLQTELESL